MEGPLRAPAFGKVVASGHGEKEWRKMKCQASSGAADLHAGLSLYHLLSIRGCIRGGGSSEGGYECGPPPPLGGGQNLQNHICGNGCMPVSSD